MSPRSTTANEIRKAIENAGLEFIEPEGIRRRLDEVKVYQGPDSCDLFFEDVFQTIKEDGNEVIALFKSPEIMQQLCLAAHDSFEQLGEFSSIKCLLSSVPERSLLVPQLQLRIIPKQHIGPISFFTYGGKHAIIMEQVNSTFKFVVFDMSSLAQAYRSNFFLLWDTASPFHL